MSPPRTDDPVPEHMSGGHGQTNIFAKTVYYFNEGFGWLEWRYDRSLHYCMDRPALVVIVFSVLVVLSFALVPFLGRAYFPRTDPGQFVISVKAPTGTRIELTDQYIARVEQDVRDVVAPQRPQHDRLEHRSHTRSFGDLHLELRNAHRVCPGEPEGRSQSQQLCVHAASANQARCRSSLPPNLLSVRRPCRFDRQSRASRTLRHPGQQQRHGRRICSRAADLRKRCERCVG